MAILVIVLVSNSGGGEEAGSDSKPPGEASIPPTNGISAPVLDVVDGDTIRIDSAGGQESVRYIGVDTPEVDPSIGVECFGEQASRFNERLVGGQTVRLDFDAERRDHYGRLLAYVHVGELFVNAELLREGYATTLTIPPNDSFAGRFAQLEQQAGNDGLGLWGAC